MSRRLRFPLLALPMSSAALFASDGKTAGAPAAEPANERGVPALFSWGDVDGDGRLDLAAVGGDGRFQLLVSASEGRFEDVTERSGLAGVANAALALWGDYDNDGRLDLFVGVREGASRLYHNEGGEFVDMSAASGLASEGAVQSAQWLDHDGDGRLDLFLVTTEESELFRGLDGGFFERAELPLKGLAQAGSSSTGVAVLAPPRPGIVGEGRAEEPARPQRGTSPGVAVASRGPASVRGVVSGSMPGPTSLSTLVVATGCANAVRDRSNPSTCLEASTSPVLGKLYPLSANLFVAVTGDVGIGTTSPAARLDVAGTARITDTLTLAPSGDEALDISTGSIYKGGALFIHTKGGMENTALGLSALTNPSFGFRNTAVGFKALVSSSGLDNTACGARALYSNTFGGFNTASGARALQSNTTGNYNTSNGYAALKFNTAGGRNTASGMRALQYNTTGNNNTSNGYSALKLNTTGSYNTACGALALHDNTTGSRNTASGYQALTANTIGNYNTADGSQALYSNTTGANNTASGAFALNANTIGANNTACGYRALSASDANDNSAFGHRALASNTTGFRNTAIGYQALDGNTTGTRNTASGDRVLLVNTSGSRNTASGMQALTSNTTGGSNTASGYQALFANTTGSRNIALGQAAGSSLTIGDDNIAIGNAGVAGDVGRIRIGTAGTHTTTFIAGIRGVTTANANAIPVVIDSAGQLGTVSSSRRFKEEIQDMGDRTDRLLALRPVTFRYKPEVQSGERPLEYGLIAEEVAEVFPELVVYDDQDKPFTVKYHLLSAMLLNELQKLRERSEAREEAQALELEALQDELTRLRGFESRFEALEARVSSVALTEAPH